MKTAEELLNMQQELNSQIDAALQARVNYIVAEGLGLRFDDYTIDHDSDGDTMLEALTAEGKWIINYHQYGSTVASECCPEYGSDNKICLIRHIDYLLSLQSSEVVSVNDFCIEEKSEFNF